MPKSSTTRWCPTPEQLLVLEKLYRSGIKTPNAVQIHQITAFLSPYGRIEGKNVFYWFQNHKARERQRLKKRLISQQQQSNCSVAVPQVEPSHPLPSLDQLPLPPPLPPPFHIPIPCIFHPQMVNQELGPVIMNPHKCKMVACENGERPLIPEIHEDGQVTTAGRLRPLVTLELFPTKSTGMKDECSPSNSKASSSSMLTSTVDQI